ncbi:helicase associated domain-containing protein [Streptomyces sp. NBC_00009]|uniref:helicase associated domain-containing protein n=1 Tax=Streptomyces sp. NBC_00009 TaxID=2975620 RepID=UPI003254BA0C
MTAARRYHRAHRHLDVLQTYEDATGYPLGRWLATQRTRPITSPTSVPLPSPLPLPSRVRGWRVRRVCRW